MTRIAVTGHMNLSPATVPLVRDALDTLLLPHAGGGLTGLSCLARGADSLFADAVLQAGGKLLAVIPSRDYRQAKVKPQHADTFDRLVAAAGEVLVMPHDTACREAYEDANRTLLQRADRLVAVWDGAPPSGMGGTAAFVTQAQEAGLPVDVVWPEGAAREG